MPAIPARRVTLLNESDEQTGSWRDTHVWVSALQEYSPQHSVASEHAMPSVLHVQMLGTLPLLHMRGEQQSDWLAHVCPDVLHSCLHVPDEPSQ